MSYLTSVKINDVEVIDYVDSYVVKDTTDDEFSTADFNISSDVLNVLTSDDLVINNEVLITRGLDSDDEFYLFRGVIAEIDKEAPIISLKCYDKLWLLNKKEVSYTYDQNTDTQAGNLSKIAFDLITTYGGLNATFDDTVQDSGSVFTLQKFICNHDKVLERIKKLADVLDWQFYYNPEDDKVYFEPLGFREYDAGTLSVGDGGNIVNNPKWRYDYERLVNKFNVIGSARNVQTTEEFTTDGSETTFQLEYAPTSVKVFLDTGSGDVLQTGGVPSSTPGSYDYTVDDDDDVRSVIFEDAPASGTLTVQYSYDIPSPILLEDTISQGKYGVFEHTEFLREVKSVNDAEVYAEKVIETFNTPFVKTKLDIVGVFGLLPGYKVRIVDSLNTEDRELTVRSVTYNYPSEVDNIDVGDKSWRLNEWFNDIKDKLKRLERANITNERVLRQVRFDDNVFFNDNNFIEVRKNTVGDGFILGNRSHGVLGSSKLGRGTGWVENVLVRMIPPNEIYVEDFGSSYFVDSSESTVSVDTDNFRLVFS